MHDHKTFATLLGINYLSGFFPCNSLFILHQEPTMAKATL